MNLFRSASLRLTVWYLVIIMALSLLFSVVLYQVSTREFQRELNRLSTMQNSPLFVPRGFAEFQNQRLEQITESKRRIQMNLIYFNFVILIGGGAVSYFLAKRTLEPIEQALEAQNRFTTDASHELRTP
jgi:signal transduction histidine kinase